MRSRALFPVLVATTLACSLGIGWQSGIAAPKPEPFMADNRPSAVPVDVELILAVDVSYSMDPEEQQLQREGYMAAITSREFMQALRGGMHGKIAITYFEWAGVNIQKVIVPWQIIEGPESADAFGAAIARAPYTRAMRTSIAGALLYSLPLFEQNPYRGLRRVLDVSGDGTNNNGPLVTVARDQVLEKGITINGLPIMLKRQTSGGFFDIENLDMYYEDCVIGGSGAFVVPIKNRDQFIEATKTKLVLEVANLMPEAKVIPVASDKPRVSCTIGEKIWNERWGSGGTDFR
jgi:hypothetical protein